MFMILDFKGEAENSFLSRSTILSALRMKRYGTLDRRMVSVASQFTGYGRKRRRFTKARLDCRERRCIIVKAAVTSRGSYSTVGVGKCNVNLCARRHAIGALLHPEVWPGESCRRHIFAGPRH
jgi:hypothetical protein